MVTYSEHIQNSFGNIFQNIFRTVMYGIRYKVYITAIRYGNSYKVW